MLEAAIKLYSVLFARKAFVKIHKVMHLVSLRGLGILNYYDMSSTGESFFLEKVLTSGKIRTVFDVGAHKGAYARFITNYDKGIAVYAFEPHPVTYLALRENTANLGIRTYNKAIGEEPGAIRLYDYQENDGSEHASVYEKTISEYHGGISACHEVSMDSIDNILSHLDVSVIDLLKIDTEGNELSVLLGAKKALENKRINIVQFEFNAMNLYSRVFFKDFVDILKGYSFYRLIQDGFVPLRAYDPLSCEIFGFQNIVAIRKGFMAPFE